MSGAGERWAAGAGEAGSGGWLPHPARPLLVTGDADLLDDLVRLATAAGCDLEVCPDAVAARGRWADAPLVLVGDDQADAVRRAGFARRTGVVIAGRVDGGVPTWRRAVDIGAEHVAVMPDAEAWLVGRLADTVDAAAPAATVVGVVGGCGGAGASTLAAALAMTAMRRAIPTTLLDADPLGGGADLLFGHEDAAGLRWPGLLAANGRMSGAALREALPRLGELAVLSWDRGSPAGVDAALSATAASRVVRAAARSCHLLVVDAARRLDAAGEAVLRHADVGLLVVPARVRSAAAAARVAGALTACVHDVRVVERGPAPGGLQRGDVAVALGLPLAGYLRPEPGLAAALERGEPPAGRGVGPLARFCAAFLDDLGGFLDRWRSA